MKLILMVVMTLVSASAFADYVPTITCNIEGHQKTPTGESFYSTHSVMRWDPTNPNGEKVMGYRFYRLDLMPDQITFKLEDQFSVTIRTLKKDESFNITNPTTTRRFTFGVSRNSNKF